MIRLGKNVTQAGDQLYDVSMDKLHKALINPEGDVASLQRRLQAIRAMDPAQYRKMKTSLPYVVCAQFHPKVRRKENFLFADRFLVDIDHLSEFDLEMSELKARFSKDERVELMFASPSGDGLKVLFKLEPRITDPAYYVVFYKAFCLQLEKQYRLGAALDHKTHDVSRCCFVSFDPDAYYNPQAVAISPETVVKKESFFDMEEVQEESSQIVKENERQLRAVTQTEKSNPGQDLPDEVLAYIKEKTGQRLQRVAAEKYYEQPEELEAIVDQLKTYLQEIHATLESIKPISYGRQIKVNSGTIWAEVNVFFGKKGVSIVATTKSGSHREYGKTVTDYLKASFASS
ncbi:MAG: hypothetical protein JJU34_14135 [Lunatimonas sp.]|uniref:CRISPR-associated primase-polymerase type B n=1 Tax=Lunatimonas sp. TaxID=2060141 RepID=UPI00263B24EA|nr:CRISPR-associated primase-polymerase type B [Lunatimonas sp.]MCC5938413.1 hypothetical protein [Lunatimonas sp.]